MPTTLTEVMVSAALPEFDKVTLTAELVVSIDCDAKLTAVGLRLTEGAEPAEPTVTLTAAFASKHPDIVGALLLASPLYVTRHLYDPETVGV